MDVRLILVILNLDFRLLRTLRVFHFSFAAPCMLRGEAEELGQICLHGVQQPFVPLYKPWCDIPQTPGDPPGTQTKPWGLGS